MAKGKYQEWLKEDGLILIQGWARDGLVESQIAHNMGISEQTLNVWKKSYPVILESLKKGKEVADYHVENALYKSATGYSQEETVIDAKGHEHVIVKHYPPNVTAQIYWLKNRRPDKWRDKPVDDSDNVPKNITITFGSEEMKEYGD